MACPLARAEYSNYTRYKSKLELELGAAYLTHYDFSLQPPSNESPHNAKFVQLQVNGWLQTTASFWRNLGGYMFIAESVGAEKAEMLGGGLKYHVFTLRNFSKALAIVDIMHYKTTAPISPDRYVSRVLVPRIGGAVNISLGKFTYLDFSVMATRFSNNNELILNLGIGVAF